jgi:hypothetical protein
MSPVGRTDSASSAASLGNRRNRSETSVVSAAAPLPKPTLLQPVDDKLSLVLAVIDEYIDRGKKSSPPPLVQVHGLPVGSRSVDAVSDASSVPAAGAPPPESPTSDSEAGKPMPEVQKQKRWRAWKEEVEGVFKSRTAPSWGSLEHLAKAQASIPELSPTTSGGASSSLALEVASLRNELASRMDTILIWRARVRDGISGLPPLVPLTDMEALASQAPSLRVDASAVKQSVKFIREARKWARKCLAIVMRCENAARGSAVVEMSSLEDTVRETVLARDARLFQETRGLASLPGEVIDAEELARRQAELEAQERREKLAQDIGGIAGRIKRRTAVRTTQADDVMLEAEPSPEQMEEDNDDEDEDDEDNVLVDGLVSSSELNGPVPPVPINEMRAHLRAGAIYRFTIPERQLLEARVKYCESLAQRILEHLPNPESHPRGTAGPQVNQGTMLSQPHQLDVAPIMERERQDQDGDAGDGGGTKPQYVPYLHPQTGATTGSTLNMSAASQPGYRRGRMPAAHARALTTDVLRCGVAFEEGERMKKVCESARKWEQRLEESINGTVRSTVADLQKLVSESAECPVDLSEGLTRLYREIQRAQLWQHKVRSIVGELGLSSTRQRKQDTPATSPKSTEDDLSLEDVRELHELARSGHVSAEEAARTELERLTRSVDGWTARLYSLLDSYPEPEGTVEAMKREYGDMDGAEAEPVTDEKRETLMASLEALSQEAGSFAIAPAEWPVVAAEVRDRKWCVQARQALKHRKALSDLQACLAQRTGIPSVASTSTKLAASVLEAKIRSTIQETQSWIGRTDRVLAAVESASAKNKGSRLEVSRIKTLLASTTDMMVDVVERQARLLALIESAERWAELAQPILTRLDEKRMSLERLNISVPGDRAAGSSSSSSSAARAAASKRRVTLEQSLASLQELSPDEQTKLGEGVPGVRVEDLESLLQDAQALKVIPDQEEQLQSAVVSARAWIAKVSALLSSDTTAPDGSVSKLNLHEAEELVQQVPLLLVDVSLELTRLRELIGQVNAWRDQARKALEDLSLASPPAGTREVIEAAVEVAGRAHLDSWPAYGGDAIPDSWRGIGVAGAAEPPGGAALARAVKLLGAEPPLIVCDETRAKYRSLRKLLADIRQGKVETPELLAMSREIGCWLWVQRACVVAAAMTSEREQMRQCFPLAVNLEAFAAQASARRARAVTESADSASAIIEAAITMSPETALMFAVRALPKSHPAVIAFEKARESGIISGEGTLVEGQQAQARALFGSATADDDVEQDAAVVAGTVTNLRQHPETADSAAASLVEAARAAMNSGVPGVGSQSGANPAGVVQAALAGGLMALQRLPEGQTVAVMHPAAALQQLQLGNALYMQVSLLQQQLAQAQVQLRHVQSQATALVTLVQHTPSSTSMPASAPAAEIVSQSLTPASSSKARPAKRSRGRGGSARKGREADPGSVSGKLPDAQLPKTMSQWEDAVLRADVVDAHSLSSAWIGALGQSDVARSVARVLRRSFGSALRDCGPDVRDALLAESSAAVESLCLSSRFSFRPVVNLLRAKTPRGALWEDITGLSGPEADSLEGEHPEWDAVVRTTDELWNKRGAADVEDDSAIAPAMSSDEAALALERALHLRDEKEDASSDEVPIELDPIMADGFLVGSAGGAAALEGLAHDGDHSAQGRLARFRTVFSVGWLRAMLWEAADLGLTEQEAELTAVKPAEDDDDEEATPSAKRAKPSPEAAKPWMREFGGAALRLLREGLGAAVGWMGSSLPLLRLSQPIPEALALLLLSSGARSPVPLAGWTRLLLESAAGRFAESKVADALRGTAMDDAMRTANSGALANANKSSKPKPAADTLEQSVSLLAGSTLRVLGPTTREAIRLRTLVKEWTARANAAVDASATASPSVIQELIREGEALPIDVSSSLSSLVQATKPQCLCQRPARGLMIECECCGTLMHAQCAGVTKDEVRICKQGIKARAKARSMLWEAARTLDASTVRSAMVVQLARARPSTLAHEVEEAVPDASLVLQSLGLAESEEEPSESSRRKRGVDPHSSEVAEWLATTEGSRRSTARHVPQAAKDAASLPWWWARRGPANGLVGTSLAVSTPLGTGAMAQAGTATEDKRGGIKGGSSSSQASRAALAAATSAARCESLTQLIHETQGLFVLWEMPGSASQEHPEVLEGPALSPYAWLAGGGVRRLAGYTAATGDWDEEDEIDAREVDELGLTDPIVAAYSRHQAEVDRVLSIQGRASVAAVTSSSSSSSSSSSAAVAASSSSPTAQPSEAAEQEEEEEEGEEDAEDASSFTLLSSSSALAAAVAGGTFACPSCRARTAAGRAIRRGLAAAVSLLWLSSEGSKSPPSERVVAGQSRRAEWIDKARRVLAGQAPPSELALDLSDGEPWLGGEELSSQLSRAIVSLLSMTGFGRAMERATDGKECGVGASVGPLCSPATVAELVQRLEHLLGTVDSTRTTADDRLPAPCSSLVSKYGDIPIGLIAAMLSAGVSDPLESARQRLAGSEPPERVMLGVPALGDETDGSAFLEAERVLSKAKAHCRASHYDSKDPVAWGEDAADAAEGNKALVSLLYLALNGARTSALPPIWRDLPVSVRRMVVAGEDALGDWLCRAPASQVESVPGRTTGSELALSMDRMVRSVLSEAVPVRSDNGTWVLPWVCAGEDLPATTPLKALVARVLTGLRAIVWMNSLASSLSQGPSPGQLFGTLLAMPCAPLRGPEAVALARTLHSMALRGCRWAAQSRAVLAARAPVVWNRVAPLLEEASSLPASIPSVVAALEEAVQDGCGKHCRCGGLAGGWMVACEDCDRWFHGACVGVTAETAPRVGDPSIFHNGQPINEPGKYRCPECAASRRLPYRFQGQMLQARRDLEQQQSTQLTDVAAWTRVGFASDPLLSTRAGVPRDFVEALSLMDSVGAYPIGGGDVSSKLARALSKPVEAIVSPVSPLPSPEVIVASSSAAGVDASDAQDEDGETNLDSQQDEERGPLFVIGSCFEVLHEADSSSQKWKDLGQELDATDMVPTEPPVPLRTVLKHLTGDWSRPPDLSMASVVVKEVQELQAIEPSLDLQQASQQQAFLEALQAVAGMQAAATKPSKRARKRSRVAQESLEWEQSEAALTMRPRVKPKSNGAPKASRRASPAVVASPPPPAVAPSSGDEAVQDGVPPPDGAAEDTPVREPEAMVQEPQLPVHASEFPASVVDTSSTVQEEPQDFPTVEAQAAVEEGEPEAKRVKSE